MIETICIICNQCINYYVTDKKGHLKYRHKMKFSRFDNSYHDLFISIITASDGSKTRRQKVK